jgi:hypothetical protein
MEKPHMLTPDECLATAKELATMAKEAPSLADSLLKMAEDWKRRAQLAESLNRVSPALM